VERRLAAILAADVVGYARMIRADEEGTIVSLQTLRSEVIDPEISSRGGRIVKLMGDGVLAEFASVVDAVHSAVAIQEAAVEHSKDLPRNERIVLRIGVNLGDVVIEGQDIHGDGVNIAARLEGLAQPGGICVSDAVHEQIRDRIDEPFEDAGEHEVKNIERPLRVWHWRSKVSADAFETRKTLTETDKPTLGISPFKNLSEDTEQGYFAEGICEDIVTGLSKISALIVVSNNDGSASQPIDLTATTAKRKLGVQFLLQGSVRKSGSRTRITAQLIETGSGSRIWSERYDRTMDDLFELQDEIVSSVVHALGAADGIIETSARLKSIESSSDASSAYDCYLQGRHHFYRHGDSEFDKAEASYLKAIELDDEFAPAYSALAWLYFVQFKLFRSKGFDEIRSKAMGLAIKALRIDKQEFRAHWVLGGIYLHDGNHAQSIAEFSKAIQINPNDANLLSWSAEALVYGGQLDEAVERCDHAVKINPNCPDWYHWIKAAALFHQGNYSGALAALNKMSSPGYAGKLKAAVHAYLGNQEIARAEAGEYMKLVPTFSIGKWVGTEHYTDPAELDRYVQGLRKAGLPE
jgi:adenylate cyclase